MKCHVVLVLVGVAAQLGYVRTQMDVGAAIHERVARAAPHQARHHPATEDERQPDKDVDTTNTRRKHGQNDAAPAVPNKVLAFGLDTGAPAETKNSIVQAVYEAFGGLIERPSVRSHGKSYKASDENKKPLSLELKTETILRGLENFLGSPKVKRIASDLAGKAASIYRAIEKEL